MLKALIIAVTVLTWNTARMDYTHKPDKNKVLHYLVSQDADVICLQEVDVYKDARWLTLQDVRQALGGKYPYSYLDFAVYNKRHQFGTMVWSKYPIVNKHSIHYESKGNISNRCDIIKSNDTIRLLNNHLESYRFTQEDIAEMDSKRNYEGFMASFKRVLAKWRRAIPIRNEQARVVRKEIDASPYPVIVVGDFNSIAWSYAFRHISEGLHDTWRELHPFQWGATYEHRGIGVRIDYILCSDPLRPLYSTIPDAQGSDHKPLVTTIEW